MIRLMVLFINITQCFYSLYSCSLHFLFCHTCEMVVIFNIPSIFSSRQWQRSRLINSRSILQVLNDFSLFLSPDDNERWSYRIVSHSWRFFSVISLAYYILSRNAAFIRESWKLTVTSNRFTCENADRSMSELVFHEQVNTMCVCWKQEQQLFYYYTTIRVDATRADFVVNG
jgi:hypothetical protein